MHGAKTAARIPLLVPNPLFADGNRPAWKRLRSRIDISAPLPYSFGHTFRRGRENVRRAIYRAILSLVAAALLLSACGGTSPTPAPTATATQSPQAFDLVILHTNDVRGFTEPCG